LSQLLTSPISPSEEHGWHTTINGRWAEVSEFITTHPKLGTLSWGSRPEGTVGWFWKEIGGGGVGTIPFAILENSLSIGLVREARATSPSGYAWNIPRGFLDPNATHFLSAKREIAEEVGPDLATTGLEELGGEPSNCNSTFFDTRAGGFRFFCLEIPATLLEATVPNPRLRPGLFQPLSRPAEKILECRFFNWREAVKMPDGFTSSGVARLLAQRTDLLQFIN
jgi:hypothetical protein